MPMQTVQIRLKEWQLKEMQKIMKSGRYYSRCELIRHLIDDALKQRGLE